jgi:hypothetical protein
MILHSESSTHTIVVKESLCQTDDDDEEDEDEDEEDEIGCEAQYDSGHNSAK